jgi:dihydrofolate synthase/folylpolyglutamate synthase
VAVIGNREGDGRAAAELAVWLERLQQAHPSEIELGLERVGRVWRGMLGGSMPPVISVAGTNGKGSSVTMLESILRLGGYKTGLYTSPHLVRFNERIRIGGEMVDDGAIVQAFERVEAARQGVSLTYFEFTTLAAFHLFMVSQVEVMILEVGLGGRLDAVNILDADLALVTTVDLDHSEWLGSDRESIGREKAGIYRGGRPAIFAGDDPPASLLARAREIGADLYLAGRDYQYQGRGELWAWQWRQEEGVTLPKPGLSGDFQLANAAAVVAALRLLDEPLPVPRQAIADGLRQAQLAGRMQRIPGQPGWLLDVAHNEEAAKALADTLKGETRIRRVVFSMLDDKPVEQVAQLLASVAEIWFIAPLECPRACSVERMEAALAAAGVARIRPSASLMQALAEAAQEASREEQVLVFGSFYTVGGALEWLERL